VSPLLGSAITAAREKLIRPINAERGEKIKEGMSKSTKRHKKTDKDTSDENALALTDSYQLALTMANAYAYFIQNQGAANQILSAAPLQLQFQPGSDAATQLAFDALPPLQLPPLPSVQLDTTAQLSAQLGATAQLGAPYFPVDIHIAPSANHRDPDPHIKSEQQQQATIIASAIAAATADGYVGGCGGFTEADVVAAGAWM
jgi:hypothetical protein